MKDVLKKVFSFLGKGVDFAADQGVPIAKQIDSVMDLAKDVKVRTKADKEKIETALIGLKEIKITLGKRGTIEHKRLKVAAVNGLAVLAIYAGFDPEVADQIALAVTGPALAYILGDSYRPSR